MTDWDSLEGAELYKRVSLLCKEKFGMDVRAGDDIPSLLGICRDTAFNHPEDAAQLLALNVREVIRLKARISELEDELAKLNHDWL